jgi:antitoxin component YwqK of YwqJK toxin-antitoxin module
MKNYLIILILFISLGFSQEEYNFNDLIKMDNGLYTVKFSHKPISGKVYGYFGEVQPLKKLYMGNLLNGKQEGKWTIWWNNGQRKYVGIYKDGIHVLQTYRYENGKKQLEGTHRNGKKDGLWTKWYENGEKWSERTFKDGLEVGVSTYWWKNGQKQIEGTYKDGKIFSRKDWNEDGSVKN